MGVQHIGTLVVPNAGTDSNVLDTDSLGRCDSISIICAEAALTGVCSVEIGYDKAGSGFATLNSPPGTPTVIAADTAIILASAAFPSLRIHSASAEAAARTFYVWGQVRN
jgi:hypothetical protein